MGLFKKKAAQVQTSMSSNIMFNTIYNVLVLLIPLITIPYVSRSLTSSGVGSFSYASSLVTYFAAFAQFGFTEYGSYLLAKHRNDRAKTSELFYELFAVRITITCFVLAIYLGLVNSNFLYSSDFELNDRRVFNALSLFIVGGCLEINFLYMGLENFKTISIRSIIVRILNFVAIIVFIKGPNDYFKYVLIMSLSSAASGLSMFVFIHKYLNRPHFHKFNPMKHVAGCLPFLIPYLATIFLPLVSKTVLGSMLGNANASGDYEVADKLLNVVYSIVSASSAVALSRMSFLYAQKDYKEINAKVKETLQFYSILALPCFFGLMGINKYFIPGFFGEDYIGAVNILYILGPKILLSPFYAILGSVYYVPKGKTWLRSIFLVAGLLINLGLSIVFTKLFSQTGAALASTLTELVLVILFVGFAGKQINYKGAASTFVKALDASLIMFVAIFGIGKLLEGRFGNLVLFLILLVLGGLIYAICMMLFREETVNKLMKRFKNTLFPKKKGKS